MAAETSTGGDTGLTSRPTTVQASPSPASGGAVDFASENSTVREGPDSERVAPASAAILHVHLHYAPPPPPPSLYSSPPRPSPPSPPLRYDPPPPPPPEAAPPVSRSHLEDLSRAMNRLPIDNNPTSSAGGEVHISETSLSKAVQQLRDAVATRYSELQRPTIYKVPDELVKYGGDRKDYDPVAVYLGGFAHDLYMRRESKLEAYKWCCVRQFIGLPVETDEARELLLGCMETMQRLLPRVRASYYQGTIVWSDEQLAEMMLLDGCFVLHCLLKYARAEREEDDDWTQVYGRCFVWESVTRDLLLLENQIPLFVVKGLFLQLRNEGEHEEELLFTGSLTLFRSLGLQMRDLSLEERENVHHLLHLFYMSVGSPQLSVSLPYRHEGPGVSLPELPQWIPCAKELEEAGVRFRKRRNATSFLDILFDYRRGVLEIPPLQLYDSSSAVFRNLIAFEQAYPATKCDVSAYAVFMDCLIKTPEDMRILHLRGILVNQMSGEQDTSRFFSKICAGVHFHADNYLVKIMEKVSKYKESRRHNWRAALVRNYFGNPWLAMSVVAAVLLLGLTMLQTFFTVYPYYKPSK